MAATSERKAETSAKWRRRKEARPAEIAAAALACFAERGFAASSLDEIAARAGITKGTLYLYFKNKEELLKAVVQQALLPRIALFEEAARADEPAMRQLERFVIAWRAAIATPNLSVIPRLIIAESGNFPDLSRFYFQAVIERARHLVVGILKRGMRRGELRRLDADAAFFSVVAPLLIAMLWQQIFERHDKKPLDIEALGRTHLAILQGGLAREGKT
jgi:AcrR family transcriptional regulator